MINIRRPTYTSAQADYGLDHSGNPYVNTFCYDRWDKTISEATGKQLFVMDAEFSVMFEKWKGYVHKPLVNRKLERHTDLPQKLSTGKSLSKITKKIGFARHNALKQLKK